MYIKLIFDDGGDTKPNHEFRLDYETANLLHRALDIREKAEGKFDDYNSLHEAYGLLREEFFEFEKEVFLKQSKRDPENVHSELADIIAVCLRTSAVDISK